jgi:uncharacterized membrane protein (UPF0136 family)
MTLGIAVAIAYGILSIIGGIVGYQKSGSKISLISGGICGTLLTIGGFVAMQQAWGLILAAVMTAVLVAAFTMRFIKTRKFMPAGLMLILGVPALIILGMNVV